MAIRPKCVLPAVCHRHCLRACVFLMRMFFQSMWVFCGCCAPHICVAHSIVWRQSSGVDKKPKCVRQQLQNRRCPPAKPSVREVFFWRAGCVCSNRTYKNEQTCVYYNVQQSIYTSVSERVNQWEQLYRRGALNICIIVCVVPHMFVWRWSTRRNRNCCWTATCWETVRAAMMTTEVNMALVSTGSRVVNCNACVPPHSLPPPPSSPP